ncbi:diguanylate cyclase [Carboxydochorda subterranea]|uniref:Diguanylate cyclase n=1 Tax=Carboxydichorda subterranea TaxID=3109565 RepID=A0ABZ1BZ80_9FIRM|nr:diguanylate cyclase [Limnochorda sp. L945t]WRP17806.1 diguanylate cyclase [Limnochorda sp. L945t]
MRRPPADAGPSPRAARRARSESRAVRVTLQGLAGLVRRAAQASDEGAVWGVLGEVAARVLGAGTVWVALPSEGTGQWQVVACSEPPEGGTPGAANLGAALQSLVTLAVRRGRTVECRPPPSRGLGSRAPALRLRSSEAYLCVPVFVEGRARAVLVMPAGKGRGRAGGRKARAQLLAELAGSIVEQTLRAKAERETAQAGIRALVAALEAREPAARGHGQRVASTALLLARAMGLDEAKARRVEMAALLHDVGKLGVPDAILAKPGPLEPAERVAVVAHPEMGARIVAEVAGWQDLAPMVRHHHEWYGGGGYPDGLAGDAIPLGAAIIGVAEALDAMTTERPYRPARRVEEALEEIGRCAGTQFHPEVVDALHRVMERRAEPPEAAPLADGEPVSPGAGAEGPLQGARVIGLPPPEAGCITPVHLKELAALYRLAQAMRDVLDMPALLFRVLDIIESELGWRDCCIFLVEPGSEDLTMAAASGAFSGWEGLRLRRGQGMNGWVAAHGVPVLVPDVTREPRYVPGPASTRSEVVVPVSAGGRVIGTLTVDAPVVHAFSLEQVQAIAAVAHQAAVAVEVAQLHQQVRRAAIRDGLTGLFNHRHFYERLEEELERAARYGYGLHVAIGDVDGLKGVNDSLGHLAGDKVLAELARLLRQHSRRYDVVARYGGDEFAVIMPQTDRQGALAMTRRLDGAAREAVLAWQGRLFPLPTVSWGLAGFPEDGHRPAELVAVADTRMYLAKRERGLLRPADGRGDAQRGPDGGQAGAAGASG